MRKKIGFALISSVVLLQTEPAAAETVTVQKGDTLYSLARKGGVSVPELMTNNGLRDTGIYVGQVLSLTKTPTRETVKDSALRYTVKPGDTLYRIAVQYKTTVESLQARNGLQGSAIHVGQVLSLDQSEPAQSPPRQPSETNHVVGKGDTLYRLSVRYGISVDAIKKNNGLKSDTLYVGQLISFIPKETTGTSVHADRIISDALSLRGVPYVWGGTTTAGFDCSGFIQYVFKLQGISLPRTTQQMWAAGKEAAQLNKGDLVFFETYEPGPSHAGIYIGNGEFVHSGSSTGVTTANLSTEYYKQRYLGFRSVAQQ